MINRKTFGKSGRGLKKLVSDLVFVSKRLVSFSVMRRQVIGIYLVFTGCACTWHRRSLLMHKFLVFSGTSTAAATSAMSASCRTESPDPTTTH